MYPYRLLNLQTVRTTALLVYERQEILADFIITPKNYKSETRPTPTTIQDADTDFIGLSPLQNTPTYQQDASTLRKRKT